MKQVLTIAVILIFYVSCGDKQRTMHAPKDIINSEAFQSIEKPIPNIIKPDLKELPNLVKLEKFLPTGYSSNGDIDYTEVIQRALNENRNVEFPDFPIMVNDKGLLVKSNSILVFPKNSLIKLKSSDKVWYAILHLKGVENVTIYSPKIEGDRYRRLNPESEEGNWGMGLVIKSSKNVKIYNPTITKCWGDGVYIGRGEVDKPNDQVLIYQAIIDDNRRNGMSIICGKNIDIIEPVISNTRGKAPQSGIDVEPNGPEDIIQNLNIMDPYTYNNGYIGIVLSLSQLVNDSNHNVSINITNHVDKYSENGFMIASFRSERKDSDKRISGNIVVKNPKWMFNKVPYVVGVTRGLCPLIEFIGAEVYSDENNPQLVNNEAQSKMNLNNDEVVFRSN